MECSGCFVFFTTESAIAYSSWSWLYWCLGVEKLTHALQFSLVPSDYVHGLVLSLKFADESLQQSLFGGWQVGHCEERRCARHQLFENFSLELEFGVSFQLFSLNGWRCTAGSGMKTRATCSRALAREGRYWAANWVRAGEREVDSSWRPRISLRKLAYSSSSWGAKSMPKFVRDTDL